MAEDKPDDLAQSGAGQGAHDHPTSAVGDTENQGPDGGIQDMAGPGTSGVTDEGMSPEVKEGLGVKEGDNPIDSKEESDDKDVTSGPG